MPKEHELFPDHPWLGNQDFWLWLHDSSRRAQFWNHRRLRWVQELEEITRALSSEREWRSVALFWIRLHGIVAAGGLFEAPERIPQAIASCAQEEMKARELTPGDRRDHALATLQATREGLIAVSQAAERLTEDELTLINFFRDVECHPKLDTWGFRFNRKGRLETQRRGKPIEELDRTIGRALAKLGGNPISAAIALAARLSKPLSDLRRALEALEKLR